MRRALIGIFSFLILTGFMSDQQEAALPTVRNDSFKRGEVIEFKMTYGFFTVGKGAARIDNAYYKMNDRYCFKVDVSGKTVGMIDWVADIDDKWGSYIDTAALVPHQFYRKIREGRYKKDEWTNFDHVNKKIEVKAVGRNGKAREPKYFDAPSEVRDLIGGFLYLRIMDFSNLKVNDTVTVNGFLEDEFYKLKIIYRGKDTVKLKIGKVRALVFTPVMPANKLFDGEDSITAFFSDDKNRIPLKIDAKMFVGSAGVELTGYSGLKNPLNLVR
jgi:hypothetical protein